MVTSKARWTKAATRLALTATMSAMVATPAAAATAARAAALRDCSWMSDDDWSYAYRACMAPQRSTSLLNFSRSASWRAEVRISWESFELPAARAMITAPVMSA